MPHRATTRDVVDVPTKKETVMKIDTDSVLIGWWWGVVVMVLLVVYLWLR